MAPVRFRAFIASSVAAATLLLASASDGQGPQAPPSGAGTGPQAGASVDPQSVSCKDLKAQVGSTGQLNILSGPRGGWGDTFYGPAVPRCPFWQMPTFAYVRARDGLCGVGYICVDKYSID